MKDDNKDIEWQKVESDKKASEAEIAAAQAVKDENEEKGGYYAADDDELEEQGNHSSSFAAQQEGPTEPANYWKWASILSLVVIAALVVTLVMNPFGSNKTLAKVNGTIIDKDKLYEAMYNNYNQQSGTLMGKAILDELINTELINQEVAKQKITVSDAELTAFLDTIKKRFPTEQEFQNVLTQQGLTIEMVKKQLLTQLQLRKVFASQTKVTDAEAKKFFDDNPTQFAATPEQVQVSHILLKTQEEADAVIAQLKSGADFATLAKEKSIEPAAKTSGGDLGAPFAATDTNFDPTFVAAAFTLQKGEISSKAVQTQFGFHVIKVNDRIPAKTFKFEEKKEEIITNLSDQKMGPLVQPWLDELRKKAGFAASATAAPPAQ